MKKIRVKFVDQGEGFASGEAWIRSTLSRVAEVEEVAENPDYLFCGVFGNRHMAEGDAIRILYTPENLTPDFNWYDYAIGFDRLSFGDRYLRAPIYAFYPAYRRVLTRVTQPKTDAELLNRKFCSFVVSNGSRASDLRDRFFRRLSQYRPVDSGGRHLNNIGGRVADKLEFCARYKFNIAFENSAHRGYVTEKVVEPLSVWSVPIYWGDPEVTKDVREEAIVRVRSEADIERAVAEIIRLDTDDAAYLAKCRAEALVNTEPELYDRQLEAFLRHIVEQPLAEARRVATQGRQKLQRTYETRAVKFFRPMEKLLWFLRWKCRLPV